MVRALLAGLALAYASVASPQAGSPPKPAEAAAPAPPPPAPAVTFSVSGTVSGARTADVTVTLAAPGGTSTSIHPGAAGEYAFKDLPNGTYALSASLAGYQFSPAVRSVTVNGASLVGQDFAGTLPTYTVSGVVSGAVVANVVIALAGGNIATATTKTDGNGRFEFPGVPNGTYTLSAVLDGYVFTPANVPVGVNGANATQSFTSAKASAYKIIGTLTGAAAPGATITVTGANTASTTATASGSYTVPGLAAGTYTVTPSATGFLFTPSSATVQVTDGDAPQNFLVTATQCTQPAVSFKWVGTHGAYLTTNPKFAPSDRGAAAATTRPPSPNAPGSCSARPEPPSIRLLGRDGTCLFEVKDVKGFRHCGSSDTAGCQEQVYPVALDQPRDAELVKNGYRVTVEFTGLENCSGQVRVEDVPVLEQHHLAIDVGSSFGLNGAGSFVSHLELALNATSRWKSWLFGDVDLRLTTFEDNNNRTAGQQLSLTQSGQMTLDAAARALLSVALTDGFPFVRAEADSYQPWFVPVLGGGLRTAGPGAATDVRGRLFAGGRFQVLGYNAGEPAENFGNTRGFVELGYARDQFWRGANEDRLYAEGQIEIPSFGSRWVRLLLRAKVDRGIGPPGDPAEVRLSVLSSINPSTLGALLGVSPKK